MAKRWNQLKSLDAGQWWVMLLSIQRLPRVAWHLHQHGYRNTRTWVESSAKMQSGLCPEMELALAQRSALAVNAVAARLPGKPQCLSRSLTLGWFLGRKGIPYHIQLGVPTGDTTMPGGIASEFSAHAWVESHGCVINDREDIRDDFTPFQGVPEQQ